MLNNTHKCSVVALAVAVAMLSGCGGGSSNAVTPVLPTTPVSNEPIWEPGVYESQSSLIAQCETPRTGTDPFTGSAYPDAQGSALEEKLWLRSWTNDTYLWYDEVPDNNPANYSVIGYFDQLKTTELTSSGTAKDNFHFSQDTAEYNELTQSGVSSGYGFDWEFVASTSPRELIVRFTEEDSPAALANVPRGASLVTVNGIDFVNDNTQSGVDAINAALFPDNAGTVTNFEFALVDGSSLAVELTSADITVSPVQNVSVLDLESGKTGYFQFNTFIRTAQDSLIDAFDLFVEENVTELVIDLRYNGGGLLALASQVSYMVAGPSQTNNAIFETTRFNDKSTTTNPVTGGTVQATPFYSNVIDYNAGTLTSTLLPSLSLTRVYVITTGSTCSASEAVINALRGIDVEVVQIGSTTCGKPYGFYPADNCGETYFTIQFQGVNNKGFGDYADGFMPTTTPNFDFELPGCDIDDDFTAALGNPEEGMLAAAIEYSSTGSCPVVTSTESLADTSANKESTSSTLASAQGSTQQSTLLAIDNPNTQRETLVLQNKINEPVIEERP
ncbi:S41 family peptidase [Alteromonas sp. 1_MG-2023]|uniref:S41 family peptidase n=1 Tax=Alteromonas sp. 1_MG-2023 TaxID=3062669 RepID=UPI0026E38804|nr:S41 family peptidase [Alteromonas sp. 1_MG-2023]MDO6568571.1 S41 family peptidase [Alteromonas sp. 1_MG-2023]